MINLQLVDDLARRLGALLPPGMAEARVDLEKNFRAALQSGLQRLDLVTREEFEVQRAVLLRTREKIDALERAVEILEARLASPSGSSTCTLTVSSSASVSSAALRASAGSAVTSMRAAQASSSASSMRA